MFSDFADERTVLGSESTQLRLDLVGGETGRIRNEGYFFHVEFFFENVEIFFGERVEFICADKQFGQRLSVFYGACVSCGPAERNDIYYPIHVFPELSVYKGFVANGEGGEMNGNGNVFIEGQD